MNNGPTPKPILAVLYAVLLAAGVFGAYVLWQIAGQVWGHS